MSRKKQKKNARQDQVEYLRQCVRDLEVISEALVKAMKRREVPIPLVCCGVCADQILTPYSSGEFLLQLELSVS